MGGKHKQAQRTKNNARPSSSGRSAELLRNTSTYVGFTTVKDGSTPVLPGFSLNPDEVETQGNSEFTLVMKKMYKKDSTTKLKALQEFADLCKRSDVNEIKGALPQWPHIYNLLALDADHRVREASHQAQRQLAILTKKSLAPYLKALAGPWFTGQYDTYPPAATAARQAFQDAFPPSKTVEAISFCQEEIFNYISDNLINQTAKTLSNPKNSSAEEMEAKYTRVLISSLQGYSYYLQQLPAKLLKDSEETNKKLISTPKFWKYARNSSPMVLTTCQDVPDVTDTFDLTHINILPSYSRNIITAAFQRKVRSSWFSALIAICQKAPFLLEDQGSQVAHAVFGNLDEMDPSTLPLVWEAALHALVTIKDCWSHVNPHKVVFPKLWHVLKEGGQGNASTIFPNLLPLLSKIPSELLSDKELFYKRFFDNMREGFKQTSVQHSQSESNAVSVTFIECLRYIIMVHQDDEAFCSSLLTNQLIPILKDSFVEKKWKLLVRALYSQVSALVHHWHKNSSESPCFEALTKIFWEQVTDVIAESIYENLDMFAYMSRNQQEFILHLKYPGRQKRKENLKVGFVDCEEKLSVPTTTEPNEPTIVEDVESTNFENNLLNLAVDTCEEYLNGASLNNSRVFVDALSNLVLEFNSPKLLSHLAKNGNGSDDAFLEKLFSWLHDPSMCSANVVKVLFLILVQLDTEEKESTLLSLLELKDVLILQWCLIDAVTSHYGDACVRKWLKSPRLSEIIINSVKDVSTNSLSVDGPGDTEAFQTTWNVLKCCFSNTSDGDFPVAMDTLISIVKILSDGLSPKISPQVTQVDPNSSAKFVGELTCALFNRESLSSVPLVLLLLGKGEDSPKSQAAGSVLCDLALSMFTTCCIGQHHSSVLHTSTLSLLGTAWQTLVSSMAQALKIGNNLEPFLEVTDKFAKATWTSTSPTNGISSIEVASMKAVAFMQAALEACTDDDILSKETILISLCEVFFKYATNSPDCSWDNLSSEAVMQICIAAEYLRNSAYLKKEVNVEEGEPEKFLLSVSVSLFIVNVLSNLGKCCGYLEEECADIFGTLSDGPSKSETEESSCHTEESKGGGALQTSYEEILLNFLNHLTKAVNVFSLCKLFLLHFKNDPLSLKISPRHKLLKAVLKKVIGLLGEKGVRQLKDKIIAQVEEYNGLGLWTIRFLYSELLMGQELFSVFTDLKSNSSLQQYHVQIIQIFSSFLPKEEFEELASESAKALHSHSGDVPEDEGQVGVWPYGYLSIIVSAVRSITIPWNDGEDKKMENAVKTALDSILLKRQSGSCSIFTQDMSLWTYMEASAVIEVADFLEGCVKNCRKMLHPHQWDLLLCSMVAWVQSLATVSEKHVHLDPMRRSWWHTVGHAAMASTIFRLVATVVGTIEGHGHSSVEVNNMDDKETTTLVTPCLPEDLISEWHDVYAAEIYNPLVRMFSLMTDSETQRKNAWGHLEILIFEDIVRPIRVIPANCLSKCPFPCLMRFADDKGSYKVSFLAADLMSTLRSPVIPLQSAAYIMILKLVPDLIEEDKKVLAFESSDPEKIYEKLSCYQLKDHLSEAQSVVDTMLMDFRVGDSCAVQPFTDTYTYTSAYFLQWKVILEMCRLAEPELRFHYAQWLRVTGHLSSLLHNVFRLLPDQLLQGCSIQVNSPSYKMLSRLFESKLAAQAYYGAVTTENLERLVSWVWVDTFRYLPALVRHWWNDLEARSNSLVERLTAVYLSPLLCAEEMRAVQAEEKTFSNMMIKVHHTVREVVAIYTVDDAEAELLIQLPNNHPLGLVKVESGKYLFSSNHCHNWLRQITILLNYQNGSIWNGLALWKKYLDRRFEGVEECFICYSILHNSNYQIPKLSCHTCKKKFHSQCLYKWFSTSNNSTCPICRNLWKY